MILFNERPVKKKRLDAPWEDMQQAIQASLTTTFKKNIRPGLMNLGCSCYFNVLLQIYFHLPNVLYILLTHIPVVHARLKQSTLAENERATLLFLYALQTFYAVHYFASPKLHSPKDVFEAFCAAIPACHTLTPYQQQDIGEMHDHFVDAIISAFALLGIQVKKHFVLSLKTNDTSNTTMATSLAVSIHGDSLQSCVTHELQAQQLKAPTHYPSSFAIQPVRVVFDEKQQWAKNRKSLALSSNPFATSKESCSIAAVVYHLGSNPLTGHYMCVVRQPYAHLSSASFLSCNDHEVAPCNALDDGNSLKDLALVVYQTKASAGIVAFLSNYTSILLDALPPSIYDAVQHHL